MATESKEISIMGELVTPAILDQDIDALVEYYPVKLERVIALTDNLVFPFDDQGIKERKEHCAAINKFANGATQVAKTYFKEKTSEAQQKVDDITRLAKRLLDNREKIIQQGEAAIQKRLDNTRFQVSEELDDLLNLAGISPEFRETDIEPLIRLSGVLTEGGKLTIKAKAYLNNKVNECLAKETLINKRLLLIENACFKANINPPLTKQHLGEFLFSDEVNFNAKLIELVDAEVSRNDERAAIQQRQINAALAKQQADADQLARFKAQKEAAELIIKERKESADLAKKEKAEAEEEARAERLAIQMENDDYVPENKSANLHTYADEATPVLDLEKRKYEKIIQKSAKSIDGKVEFTIMATFKRQLPENTSMDAVRCSFINQISEKFKQYLVCVDVTRD